MSSRPRLCVALLASAGLLGAGLSHAATRAPHGALVPLSGGGSCLGDRCAPLRGFGRATFRSFNDIELELSSNGRQIFAIGGSRPSIAVLARDPSTGRLRQLSGPAGCITSRVTAGCVTVPAMAHADRVALSPDGGMLAVISFSSPNRVAFSRDPRTGALRRIGSTQRCLPALDGPCLAVRGIAGRIGALQLSPRTVLIFGSGSVAFLTRASTAGRWRQPRGRGGCANRTGSNGCSAAACLPGAAPAATLSSDHRAIYVTGGGYDVEDTGEGALASFARRNDGSAVPLGCARTGHDSISGFAPLWISSLPGSRTVLVLVLRGNRGDGILWERMFAAMPGPGGALQTPHQISTTLSGEPSPVSLAPDGRTFYAVDDAGPDLDVYRVRATMLQPLAAPWFHAYVAPRRLSYGPNDVLRSRDGRYVYVAGGSASVLQDRHAPQIRAYRVAS